MKDLDTLCKVMNSGDVKRYHTLPTIGEQTNATHSWGVAVIATYLHPNLSAKILLKALMHDVGEIETGDIPAPVKWENPELKKQLHLLEEKVAKNLEIDYELTEYEQTIFKQADMFELLFFCVKQRRLGNRHINHVFSNGVEKLSDGNLNEQGNKLLGFLLTIYGGL
tara:strand:+ start:2988 stop:3488 length:501 start_codon:yes stop_codon:yes gene_type:complete